LRIVHSRLRSATTPYAGPLGTSEKGSGDKTMNGKLLKHITPLKILGIFFLILTIKWAIIVDNLLDQGREPGLGGLTPLIFGFFTLMTIFFDCILTYVIKIRPRINLLIQLGLIALLFLIYYIKYGIE
jgi:hypothetical protein